MSNDVPFVNRLLIEKIAEIPIPVEVPTFKKKQRDRMRTLKDLFLFYGLDKDMPLDRLYVDYYGREAPSDYKKLYGSLSPTITDFNRRKTGFVILRGSLPKTYRMSVDIGQLEDKERRDKEKLERGEFLRRSAYPKPEKVKPVGEWEDSSMGLTQMKGPAKIGPDMNKLREYILSRHRGVI